MLRTHDASGYQLLKLNSKRQGPRITHYSRSDFNETRICIHTYRLRLRTDNKN